MGGRAAAIGGVEVSNGRRPPRHRRRCAGSARNPIGRRPARARGAVRQRTTLTARTDDVAAAETETRCQDADPYCPDSQAERPASTAIPMSGQSRRPSGAGRRHDDPIHLGDENRRRAHGLRRSSSDRANSTIDEPSTMIAKRHRHHASGGEDGARTTRDSGRHRRAGRHGLASAAPPRRVRAGRRSRG